MFFVKTQAVWSSLCGHIILILLENSSKFVKGARFSKLFRKKQPKKCGTATRKRYLMAQSLLVILAQNLDNMESFLSNKTPYDSTKEVKGFQISNLLRRKKERKITGPQLKFSV